MKSRSKPQRRLIAIALAAVVALTLPACSSGGSSSDSEEAPEPGVAGPNEVLIIANNEFRQTVALRYQFATGQPRRAGTVSAGQTREIRIRPLTGDLVFLVSANAGEETSNAMQVRGGETYELLIRDNFRPQLIRRN
jgi:hypothetical protein